MGFLGGSKVFKTKHLKNDEQGFALVWVLIFFMIFSILSVSLWVISNQDLLEAKNDQSQLRAYYLAESGADLVYAALMKKPTPSDAPLINTYQTQRTRVHTQTISLGADKIEIRIESVSIDGKWWVKVTSKGIVSPNNVSETTVLRVNVGMDNFVHVIREND